MIYVRYAASVLLHKWYVFLAGRRLGVPLRQLLVHDLSKFSPAEFGPFARRFGRGTGGKLEHETEPAEWRAAFEHHWIHNPHHWEYWAGGDGSFLSAMPEEYAREMVADWAGASRAYTGSWSIKDWYAKNTRLQLHATTRARVERLIKEWEERIG
jgi:hypothetical protein